eukprot:Gb_00184 [translate_table: standard]
MLFFLSSPLPQMSPQQLLALNQQPQQ